ncbi:hypothetical protein A9Q84_00570 [Halobacteriovorax marinus]|uniref:ABC transporter domain-containing protein n=1 Tax=Halobacteriovorax marinus TaxID=97084 RepID=A0A1Y5FFM0_9BACT|nr:hypothetical protein A9Q84_00570 [Halobacteriovorax marinus]
MKELILKATDLVGRTTQCILGANIPYNFELYAGEVGILFSENESSELGRLIAAQGTIKRGSLKYHTDIGFNETSSTWKQNIGFGFREKGLLSNLSLFENVHLPVNYYNADPTSANLALKDIGVSESLWNKRPHQVSQSIQKLTLLARSIVLAPKLLFLDDPSALLSPTEKKEFYHWIQRQRKKGLAILIATDEIYRAATWGDWYICPRDHVRKDDFKEIFSPEQLDIQAALKKQMNKKDFFDELLSS